MFKLLRLQVMRKSWARSEALDWEASLVWALTLSGSVSVDVSYGERGRDRDPAKGKMCKHQTTDVLKILSGRIYGGDF